MSQTDNKVAEWLGKHPKMTGILFMMMLLLSQTGSVAASNGSACAGP